MRRKIYCDREKVKREIARKGKMKKKTVRKKKGKQETNMNE